MSRLESVRATPAASSLLSFDPDAWLDLEYCDRFWSRFPHVLRNFCTIFVGGFISSRSWEDDWEKRNDFRGTFTHMMLLQILPWTRAALELSSPHRPQQLPKFWPIYQPSQTSTWKPRSDWHSSRSLKLNLGKEFFRHRAWVCLLLRYRKMDAHHPVPGPISTGIK